MKTSNNILKMYVQGLEVSDKEFSERITLTGTKTECFYKLNKNLDKIVVAKINSIKKHENADKLSVCDVSIGNENIQIVTGATNIYEGMICPAVLVGGKVASSAHDTNEYPNGIVIKQGKLRGVDSYGMLCSIEELGQSRDLYGGEDGIFDLKEYDCKVGDDAIKVLGLDDTVYDFEITSNRIDCYSTIGIAKEVSATFNLEFKKPNLSFETNNKKEEYISLDIKNDDLCEMFSTRLIKNIKIEESPLWLKNALRIFGIRPINNIVDITNFVMMEYGQPMHAYNYDKISGKKIIVRTANDNEKFVTLDGQERILDNNTLTICDEKGIIGLAGIMGGENSMITNDTTNLLLEVANFNGTNVRLTSKKLGLRTEASNLFEKGLDINNGMEAMNRALALISELKCGEIVDNSIYFYKNEKNNQPKTLVVDYNRINDLLGIDLSKEEMKLILDKLDLKTTIVNNNLNIVVPTIRRDVVGFADVAEEIIRYYGYDKAKTTLPNVVSNPTLLSKKDLIEKNAYDIAIKYGFSEAKNYSFESEKIYDKLQYKYDAVERNYIKILNPLGDDFKIMRTQLVNGILQSLSLNFNKKNEYARLFEIANIYLPKDKDISILPDERNTFILGCYDDVVDFFYMKGIANNFLNNIGIYDVSFVQTDTISFLHKGRTALIMYKDTLIGYIGEICYKVQKNYDINKRIYLLNFDLNSLEDFANFSIKYKEISKFPSVERDLSLIVPNEIIYSEIVNIIKQRGGKLLSNIKLFDIYEGEQLESGYKSIAVNLKFNSIEETLTTNQIDTLIKKILNGLENLNIKLRF